MQALLDIDEAVFYWINVNWSNSFFDLLIPWLREPLFWIPLYVFIIGFCLFNYQQKGYFIILMLILNVGTADLLSNRVFKKNIQRPRPCKTLDHSKMILRVRCGSGYSFTSNHAANHFALSFFMIFLLGTGRRRLKIVLASWAASIAIAQVYVGVHYPLDVIAGAMLGISICYLWYRVLRYLDPSVALR